MLTKTLTFTDFNGETVTETFYFNLTKAELLQMDMETGGTMKEALERIVASKDPQQIMRTFLDIVKMSYGVRSEDGRNFYKDEKFWEDFRSSAAYDVLFTELVTNENFGVEFINGVVPADLQETANRAQRRAQGRQPQDRQQPRRRVPISELQGRPTQPSVGSNAPSSEGSQQSLSASPLPGGSESDSSDLGYQPRRPHEG